MTDKPETEGHLDEEEVEAVAEKAEHLLFTDMAQYMSQFARSFEASARRWELVVYPSLLAFIILAAYGFFLIYRLTSDIGQITVQVEAIAQSMVNINRNFSSTTNNMNTVTKSMLKITKNMDDLTEDMDDISGYVSEQKDAMAAVVVSMEHMNQSIDSMSFTMYQMRHDTSTMGRNLQSTTGPMRFMNNFAPW